MMMMNLNVLTMTRWSLLALSMTEVSRAQVVKPTPIYRVRSGIRERDLQQQFNPLDMMLSFSDDGSDRVDEFYLDLFDTPDILTNSESPMAISNAMNAFLLTELNEKFDKMHSIEKVSSEILGLNQRNETSIDLSGQSNNRTGTEARMKVILSFDQSPSPNTDEVIDVTKQIMANMTYFVTNLTSSLPQSGDDNELSGVYEAIRREIRPPIPFVEPPDDITIVVDIIEGDMGKTDQINDSDEGSSSTSVLISTVPIVLVVAVLAAVVVFFVFRKRGKQVEPESPRNSAMLYMDVENEVYSVDRSVDTPKSPASQLLNPLPPHLDMDIQYNMSDDSQVQPPSSPGTPGSAIGGSVFSGIDMACSNVFSPKSMASPKSTMTGYTCGSESTVRASNLQSSSPTSMMTGYTCGSASTVRASNLVLKKNNENPTRFAFADVPEEDEDTDDIDDLELLERQPSSIKSSASQNSEENAYTGNDGSGNSTDETESTISLEGVSITLPVKSKDEEQEIEVTRATSVEAKKTDGVSQVLADLEDMETTIGPRDPTPSAAMTRNGQDPTPNKNRINNNEASVALPSKDSKETEGDNASKKPTVNVATRLSGFFKGKRRSVSTHSSPVSSPRKGGTLSAPASPIEKVGKHWLSPSKNKQTKNTVNLSSKLEHNDGEYDMDLSRPSSLDESYNDTIDDSLQIIDRVHQDPPEELVGGRRHAGDKIGDDGTAMYQADAMHPEDIARGRRHAGDKIGGDGTAMYQANAMHPEDIAGGRRHAGDKIGGDGTAMYQAKAMHPTDWSDAESVGDSTIDETNDSQDIPNQYIFKNNMNLLLDAGTDTDDSGIKNESSDASRRLIDDLVWLESKIASVRGERAVVGPGIDTVDSLSYVSNDNTDGVYEEETSNDDESEVNVSTQPGGSVHATNSSTTASSIVCKDCFAPPGKLHIVIHSTKDGPAVHTVKEGSSLEGKIFPGDLIISVDDIDTRSFKAEQVMKMMAKKGDKERKITVLHLE